MAEYIDIDQPLIFKDIHNRDITGTIRTILKANHTELVLADVVPVVRCKDCKYNLANIPDIQDGMNINDGWNACQLTELYDSVEPMDFCSRGAKMDGEA